MPPAASPAARRRPFRVLPPVTRGSESLEGALLLEEVTGDAGVILWQSLRNVMLWAAAPPEARRALFARTAAQRRVDALQRTAVDEPLREPLRVVGELLRSAASIPPARVAAACEAVSRWAEEHGAGGTALAFMQAAALAEPTDAARAVGVGRLARQRGEVSRAEGWLHKAVVLGRQNGDWDAYAAAYRALGNTALQRGNFPQARRMHARALRAAERHRISLSAAYSLHDLLVVAMEYGDAEESVRLATRALAAYGVGHPRVPYLAHDVAMFWMAQGDFPRALTVIRGLLPHFTAPSERALVVANLAWACGGTRETAEFGRAAAEAELLILLPAGDRYAAQVLLNVARGAALLDDGDHAHRAASAAMEAATRRNAGKVLASAEALAESARSGLERESVAGTGLSRDPQADDLASDLVRSLAG